MECCLAVQTWGLENGVPYVRTYSCTQYLGTQLVYYEPGSYLVLCFDGTRPLVPSSTRPSSLVPSCPTARGPSWTRVAAVNGTFFKNIYIKKLVFFKLPTLQPYIQYKESTFLLSLIATVFIPVFKADSVPPFLSLGYSTYFTISILKLYVVENIVMC